MKYISLIFLICFTMVSFGEEVTAPVEVFCQENGAGDQFIKLGVTNEGVLIVVEYNYDTELGTLISNYEVIKNSDSDGVLYHNMMQQLQVADGVLGLRGTFDSITMGDDEPRAINLEKMHCHENEEISYDVQ